MAKTSPVIALLCFITLCSASGWVLARPQSLVRGDDADVSVTERQFRDPPFYRNTFFYGYAVCNGGPADASEIVFRDLIGSDATFLGIETLDSSGHSIQIECVTPQAGQSGVITCTIPSIMADDWVFVFVYVTPNVAAGDSVSNTARADSQTGDPDPSNNELTIVNYVPYPPVLESASFSVRDDGALRVRIEGERFYFGSSTYPLVLLGTDEQRWSRLRHVSESLLVLKGGEKLKLLFPKGVPVPIRIVNADGGEVVATLTR